MDETVLPVDILVVLVAMASVLYTMTISVDKLKIVSDSVIMAVSVSMMTWLGPEIVVVRSTVDVV